MGATVQGKRSPRWVIWIRMKIPCKGGDLYLVRLRIFSCPLFGVFLHDIHEDDGARAPHSHPWSFISVVLRGWYAESLYLDPVGAPTEYVERTYRRFSLHRMGRDTAHRITSASPGLKTLILTGPRRASWGFFVDGELIDWKDYEDA